MEFQDEGCWGARRMWCFIARVEYRGIIILLDLEIQNKNKNLLLYLLWDPGVVSVAIFRAKTSYHFQKKMKKKTPQAWSGIPNMRPKSSSNRVQTRSVEIRSA